MGLTMAASLLSSHIDDGSVWEYVGDEEDPDAVVDSARKVVDYLSSLAAWKAEDDL